MAVRSSEQDYEVLSARFLIAASSTSENEHFSRFKVSCAILQELLIALMQIVT